MTLFDKLIPSDLLRPYVPQFASRRWAGPIDRGFDVADAIVAGKDEKALSLRTALFAFAIRIISAFIAYVSQVLMARWLGSHEYGIFVWVWVAAVICGGLACLGFPSAVVRFIPQYRVEKNDAALRGITYGSRIYSLFAATLLAVVGIAVTYFFQETISSIYVLPLFLAAICLPMLALAEVQDGVARAFNWIDIALSPTYLLRPVLILIAMVGALAFGMQATAATALMATIAATWFSSIVQLVLINQRLKRSVPSGPKQLNAKVWIVVALPIFLVEGFFALLTNVDILIAGAYLPPKDVAIYFAAVKTLALVHFVYFAVKAGAAHRYAQYFTAGDKPQFESFVQDTVKWTFWPSVAMASVILVLGNILLSLFGHDFATGYPLLFILVLGIVARAAIGPAESVLTMSGQQNICATVYGITLAVNIVLNLTFIPLFGLYGAAWATTIAMTFEAAALYSIVLRRLGIHMFVFAPITDAHQARTEVR